MSSNITKAHSPQCEGETAPSFSTMIESAVRERAREFIDKARTDGATIDPPSRTASQ